MSHNTAQRPPTTGMGTGTGTGTGAGAGTGMGMSTGAGTGYGTGAHTERKAAWAIGGSFFAGVLMVVIGATDILQGATAVRGDAFLGRATNYAYTFNLDAWGWLHIALGILVALTGIALLMRVPAARYVGIALTSLVLVSQFMYLPHQPLWAIVNIALSAFIIWALAYDHMGGRGTEGRTETGYGGRT
ncbi:hypothetical protein GCM10009654_59330 [Streptomyces hebeiensis]|uniref:DUF7144 domain-containing protein n=1 Tax=Streptomyces hebeiensis TaxID=229486 RepID=A0ABP4FS19_9ACTN|nr:hypothetical protein [Streptomyces sp. NRRL F-5135]